MKLLLKLCFLALAGCSLKATPDNNALAVPSEHDISETGGSNELFDSNGAAVDVANQMASPEQNLRYDRWLVKIEKLQAWQDRVRPTPHNAFPPIGQCYNTKIKQKDKYFILFTNGLQQLPDYGHDARADSAVAESQIADRVRMCVVELPDHCPPGDFRGITYRTHNLRTGSEWVAGDSLHLCGGP